MTGGITIQLGLGQSAASRQLERALITDDRFALAGSHARFADLFASMETNDEAPDVVLICGALDGRDLEDAVGELYGTFSTRVMVLHDPQRSTISADALTQAGAVHVETVAWPRDPFTDLDEPILERVLRRVVTMASVRILHRPRGKASRTRGTHSVTQLLARIEMSAHATPTTPTEPLSATPTPAEPSFAVDGGRARVRKSSRFDLIGIASSTGGQDAVQRVISALPDDFNVPIVLIQHIGADHDLDLARELRNTTTLSVLLLRSPSAVEPGRIYISRSGLHVEVEAGPVLTSKPDPRDALYRPSADIFFSSMARVLGSRGIGVVLTGMGDDGAKGLLEMKRLGATTLVQDKRSSQIFGMPRAAIALGAQTEVQPIEEIGPRLIALCRS